MSPDGAADATLGTVVEKYLGPLESHLLHHDDSQGGVTRALANWYRFNYCIANVQVREEFLSLLSEQQKNSYCLLHEWWTATYSDEGTALARILDVVRSCQDLEASDDIPGQWSVVLGHLQLKRWPSGDLQLEASPKQSRPYTNVLQTLYNTEFEFSAYYGTVAEAHTRTIELDRRNTAVRAWVQRMAWKCFNFLRHDGSFCADTVTQDVEFKDSQDVLLTRQTLGLPELTNPPIRNCPWLQVLAEPSRTTLPYYLWDRRNACTVRSADLTELPSYVAISHTWGRWLKPGRQANIPGVPWPIPENTRFEVCDLPQLLRDVPGGSPYLWLDLVCIPQDESDVALREISRQAEIFKGAKHAVAWLNDVPDWDCLTMTLQWFLLKTLELPTSSTRHEARSQILVLLRDSLSDRPSNLFRPRTGRLTRSIAAPNGWWTSLWTLQELCLRPDMWLAARDWTPLLLDGKTPTSIGSISVIKDVYDTLGPGIIEPVKLDTENQKSIAMWEFSRWLDLTGISRMRDFSRADIIAWADQRQCTGRRAEAIMSALGTTKWYTESSLATHEDDLVLDKYPVKFVKEVMMHNPGEFFCSFFKMRTTVFNDDGSPQDEDDDSDEASDIDDEQLIRREKTVKNLPNMVLPFSRKSAIYIDGRLFGNRGFRSHDSLYTWDVLVSGHVRIPRACILASSDPKLMPRATCKLRATFLGFQCRNAPTVDGMLLDTTNPETHEKDFEIDLQQWARTRTYEVHAVVLSSSKMVYSQDLVEEISLRQVQGFILCRVSSGCLWKTGNFYVSDVEGQLTLPEAQEVDWLAW